MAIATGFIPVSNATSVNTGQLEIYAVLASDTAALAVGDVVKAVNTGSAGAPHLGVPNGIPTCTRITAVNDVPVGVVRGFTADPNFLDQTYRSASTLRYVLVDTNPNSEYFVAESNASGAALALARIGTIADPFFGTVDTVTGNTSMCISSAAATGSPGMFLIQRRAEAADNPIVGAQGTFWVVTFKTHQKK